MPLSVAADVAAAAAAVSVADDKIVGKQLAASPFILQSAGRIAVAASNVVGINNAAA